MFWVNLIKVSKDKSKLFRDNLQPSPVEGGNVRLDAV